MFVTWHLSLLLQIPGVAVAFSYAQKKKKRFTNTNTNGFRLWHVTVLLQNHTVQLKLLFILQRKSNDYDIDNKGQNTTYHCKSSVIKSTEMPATFGYKALIRTEDCSLRTGPWLDFHSSSTVTLSTHFLLRKVAPLGGERDRVPVLRQHF